MAPKAPVIKAHPQLPNELCREIIANLHYYRDRDALLPLSLVSKKWCAESQRVLFRTVCDDSLDLDKRESLVHTHVLFLKTIILNPTRLGPYVQTYKQRELIRHPFFRADSELRMPSASSASYLWDLTSKALPALVNLKHLYIVPQRDCRRTSRAYLLKGCAFKLDSLTWGFDSYNPRSYNCDPFVESYDTSSPDLLVEFLCTQHDLIHLEVGSEPSMQNLSWLPDNICPSLASTACRLNSIARAAAGRRNLVGLKIWCDRYPLQALPQSHLSALLSALCRLKYLSISANRDLMSHLGTIDSHTVLLELTPWDNKTIQNLSGLSNLRVLVLLQEPQEDPSPRLSRHVPMDVIAENNIRKRLTIESFRQCPNLEYVIIEDIPRSKGPSRYRKMSLSGRDGGPGTLPDIQSEDFSIELEVGKPWWSVYGV